MYVIQLQLFPYITIHEQRNELLFFGILPNTYTLCRDWAARYLSQDMYVVMGDVIIQI